MKSTITIESGTFFKVIRDFIICHFYRLCGCPRSNITINKKASMWYITYDVLGGF